jgi:hypothetical protein
VVIYVVHFVFVINEMLLCFCYKETASRYGIQYQNPQKHRQTPLWLLASVIESVANCWALSLGAGKLA